MTYSSTVYYLFIFWKYLVALHFELKDCENKCTEQKHS